MTIEDLAAELAAAGRDFDADELAYLALTAKVEGPLRDRLAWRLHRRLEAQGLRVAREWRRCDLAITDDRNRPLLLLEAKAFADFDGTLPLGGSFDRGYGLGISRDVRKAHTLLAAVGAADADVYVLLLSTHLRSSVPRDLWPLVKYSDRYKRHVRRYDGDHAAMRHAGQESVRTFVGRLSDHREVAIPAGTAFGVNCDIDTWIVGPIPADSPVATAAEPPPPPAAGE